MDTRRRTEVVVGEIELVRCDPVEEDALERRGPFGDHTDSAFEGDVRAILDVDVDLIT